MNPLYETISFSQIEVIKPLWEKLNTIHREDSIHFKDHFKNYSFEERIEKFNRIKEDNLRIEIVRDGNREVGYCLSSIQDTTGEIESLFVEEQYRSSGIGQALVSKSLDWFTQKGCSRTIVTVAHGHEDVLGFYSRFGFYPRLLTLELKSPE